MIGLWVEFYIICSVKRLKTIQATDCELITRYKSHKTAVNILALLAGMVIYAYFADCNPIQMKRIEKTDEYFPFFVVHYLSKFPGIAGLHVSSVYAGSLSTISSGHDLIRSNI